MMTKEDFLKYLCPRWDEFPAIELYMDQVLSILENSLSGFSHGERTITSSMINNYVKQKIVKPPVKKKYDRVHLSYLYAVSILKPLMSISDICRGIAIVLRKFEIKEAYDIFLQRTRRRAERCFFRKRRGGGSGRLRRNRFDTCGGEGFCKLDRKSVV